jgi:Copper type II ascorbate-dependent monooxygenase, C-terminal domain
MGRRQVAVLVTVLLGVLGCTPAPASNGTNGTSASNGDNAGGTGHVHGAPPPPPQPLRNGERFQEVGLQQPYRPAPPQGGTDEYRCFLIDPKLTERAYLTGSQFLPQNLEIVHHAILYRIAASEVEHARSVDAAAEGDGWQCFGGTGLGSGLDSFGGGSGSSFVGGWAPGNKETLIGDIAGFPVEPGSQIVLQVHYNLLATNGKPGPTDQSSIRLRLTPGTADVTPLLGALLPGPIELPCTPEESGPLCDREAAIADLVKRTGAEAREEVDGLNKQCNQGKPPVAGDTQHCDHHIPKPVLLYAIMPHMHLLGRSISVELNPGTPTARKLLDQPAYNFDDQSEQVLPQPVQINAGDTIRVTCTHDATQRSKLPQLQTLKPRYVVWGDGTSDEMCLAILTVTTKL